MAGYSRIYCIGGEGGYLGVDGVNPIYLQILVGNADRQWLEAHYFDQKIERLGNVKTIVPQGPNHPDMLLDACIVFFPQHFDQCPTLAKIRPQLTGVERMDFDARENIPKEWSRLRDEARPRLARLTVYVAELTKYAT